MFTEIGDVVCRSFIAGLSLSESFFCLGGLGLDLHDNCISCASFAVVIPLAPTDDTFHLLSNALMGLVDEVAEDLALHQRESQSCLGRMLIVLGPTQLVLDSPSSKTLIQEDTQIE